MLSVSDTNSIPRSKQMSTGVRRHKLRLDIHLFRFIRNLSNGLSLSFLKMLQI